MGRFPNKGIRLSTTRAQIENITSYENGISRGNKVLNAIQGWMQFVFKT